MAVFAFAGVRVEVSTVLEGSLGFFEAEEFFVDAPSVVILGNQGEVRIVEELIVLQV